MQRSVTLHILSCFGKEIHRISNHGRTLFGYGRRSHSTYVMEEISCLSRTHSSRFRKTLRVTPQHLMATISGNDKEMSKILVMTEALKKWDEVYEQTTYLFIIQYNSVKDVHGET